MPDNTRLLVASMALRGAALSEWESFCAAMREYTALQVTEMLKSPPEMLLKAQGMAIGMNEISKIVNEAPTLYEARRQHGRPTANQSAAAFTG